MATNQVAADNIIHLYIQGATEWDSFRVSRFIEQAWLDRFLALIPAGGRILDVGCGGGIPVARYFLDHGHPVSGIDTSPPLIDLCRSRFPASQWRVADMRTLDLDCAFDGLIAWDSFFHLTCGDQRRMFRIFRRHANPGAALIFTSGPDHGEAIGTFLEQPLYHASLSREAYRLLLEEQGFRVVQQVVEDPDCGGRTVWLAQRDK